MSFMFAHLDFTFMNNKKKALLTIGGAAAAGLLMAIPAFAATTTPIQSGTNPSHFAGKGGFHKFKGAKGTQQPLTNAVFGTIASLDGSTFTITRATHEATTTITVTTDASTTFKKNGQADISTDLAVGQRIVVMGAKDSSGNVPVATSVNIMVRTPRTHSSASTTSST